MTDHWIDEAAEEVWKTAVGNERLTRTEAIKLFSSHIRTAHARCDHCRRMRAALRVEATKYRIMADMHWEQERAKEANRVSDIAAALEALAKEADDADA
jgi:hypothetical protein